MLARLALGNVRKSLADFGIYFLTVMLGVAVFYAFNSMTAQQGVLAFSETQSKMFDLLGMVIGGVSVFIAFVLVFLVVYANSFLIKRRKREFGVYLALGMSTGDVVKIVALESLIAGAASLAAGLVVGIGLSQLLLQLTSALFQADVAEAGGFAFVFSADALAKTAIVFAAIFLTAALLNARTVARAKLIDLLHAQRKNEEMRLTSLPLSLALFAASLVLIGVSYKLLIDNGLMEPSPEFAAATLLGCAGTVLFFTRCRLPVETFAPVKPLYLRGLNMFTLRQLSEVNARSLAVMVCLVLFLAITSVCGSIIRNAIDGSRWPSTATAPAIIMFGSFAPRGLRAEWGIRAFAERRATIWPRAAASVAPGAGDFDALVPHGADRLFGRPRRLVMDDVERRAASSGHGRSVNAVRAYPCTWRSCRR
ncbi:MAG: FtsX-like permease family protein [Eggerthella lenta]